MYITGIWCMTQPSRESQELFKLKIVVGGESNVGKTSLVHRLRHGSFPLVDLRRTIGVDFTIRDLEVIVDEGETKRVRLHLWDFGGERRFRELFPKYSEGANGIILAFDLTVAETLEKLSEWKSILDPEPNVPIFLVATKKDLEDHKITSEEINDWQKENGVTHFFQTSARTGENVEHVFKQLAIKIISR